ncbi:MAG: hypothetical protein BroJett009_05770 [Armatimonadota bacterium]|nr:MAG: hypothetical protein BroJett009_05770 [Armatimonadota bacterium]
MELGYYEMSVEGVLRPCDAEVVETLMADEDARIVATTNIDGGFVSTAFLPICLTFEDGSPQAFETVVIRGHKSLVVKRYSDLAEALKGHDQVVQNQK